MTGPRYAVSQGWANSSLTAQTFKLIESSDDDCVFHYLDTSSSRSGISAISAKLRFRDLYSRLRRGIIAHETYIDASNVHELTALDFVFVCVDRGSSKKLIVNALQAAGTPFVDVGMGVHVVDDRLLAILRVTTSTDRKRDHVSARVPQADGDVDDDYARNIQIADLNCLNAALAVLKWQKLCGFYQDHEDEHNSTYPTNCNLLTSEETP